MTIEWRPYQTEMMDAVFSDWREHSNLLAVGATGMGKTNVIFGIVDRFMADNAGARVAILAHRKELIEQPLARLGQFWPHLVKRAGVVMADLNDCHRQIVIATVQTLGNKRDHRIRELLRHGKIDLLIVDEAHHFRAGEGTYQNVLTALKTANPALKLLGVTATPERGDKKSLTEVFEKESANIGVMRLIDEGWLCTPRVHGVKTNIDLSGVSVQGSGGNRDYNNEELIAAVETDDCFKLVVKTHMEKIGNRPTIAFVPSVKGAYRLAEMLQEQGIAAIAADGTTDKATRTQILDGFRSGKHTTLINCQLWTEGLDLPQIECIHMVRPTKSDALYLQMVGRGLRIHPGKEFADIFDYQPLGARNLDMRMVKIGLKKKQLPPVMKTVGEGGMGSMPLPKAGDRIEYMLLDYFSKRKESWVEAEGWRIIGMGKGSDNIERSLAVDPYGCELWVVWRKEGERWSQAKKYAQGDFDTISATTETLLKKHAVNGVVSATATWRYNQPTENQIAFGRKLRVYQEGMNKGKLSDAINQRLVMDAIKRAYKETGQYWGPLFTEKCYDCGHQNANADPNGSRWVCENCGVIHLRKLAA